MKYYADEYVFDTAKASLVVETTNKSEFGTSTTSIYKTKKSKKFFRVDSNDYDNGHTFVYPITEKEALQYCYLCQADIKYNKFFTLEEY